MWRLLIYCLTVGVTLPTARAAEQQTRFAITKPTVISFFLDFTDAQVEAGEGGINEALDDFLFYLPAAEDRLTKAGVEVHAVFKVKSFQVKLGSHWQTVRPKTGVGYYFIAPGRQPRIEAGVSDTVSILGDASEYFQLKSLPLQPKPTATILPPPDVRITAHAAGNLTMAMTRDEILKRYPPPLSIETRAGTLEIQVFKPQSSKDVALRVFLDPDTSRIVKLDVLDNRFRTISNLGPGSTFGELLRGEHNLSLTQDSDSWAVSAAGCMTFQLVVDNATALRLGTEERIDWQHVVPALTPIRSVSLFASGCR